MSRGQTHVKDAFFWRTRSLHFFVLWGLFWTPWGRATQVTWKHKRLRGLQRKEKWSRHCKLELWATIVCFCEDRGREQLSHSKDRKLRQKHKVAFTQPEQERVRPSKRTTLWVIQEVSRKTHTNGFLNLSAEEEVCESTNTENPECKEKHEHRQTWRGGEVTQREEKDAEHRICAQVKETWKRLYNDQKYP